MSTPFPMLHVVVKDGKITGAHDEPCHLDGVASVPYAAIEPSPSPVQPETFNSAEFDGIEKLAHRIAWRYKKSSDPAHSDTWTFNAATLAQFARAVSESVRPQAEPVAVAVPCDYATRDGRLNGVNVTLVLLGNDKEIAAGEIALYAGAAPVAQADEGAADVLTKAISAIREGVKS